MKILVNFKSLGQHPDLFICFNFLFMFLEYYELEEKKNQIPNYNVKVIPILFCSVLSFRKDYRNYTISHDITKFYNV